MRTKALFLPLTWSFLSCSICWPGINRCDRDMLCETLGRLNLTNWSLWLIGGGPLRFALSSFRLTPCANQTHLNRQLKFPLTQRIPKTQKRINVWPRKGKILEVKGNTHDQIGFNQPCWEKQMIKAIQAPWAPVPPGTTPSSSCTQPFDSFCLSYLLSVLCS